MCLAHCAQKTRYDGIVVGTRVAGAATAMLLARAGLRVLAVDRAGFPSDTLSTHQVQLPGVSALGRWGLLGRLSAAGTPATPRLRFDTGRVLLDGHYPAWDGADPLYSPRPIPLHRPPLASPPDGGAAAAFPPTEGLPMIYVASPASEFAAARRDLEAHYLASLQECGDLGERVRAGRRAERLRTTPDLPSRLNVSSGPGWALAGDAGLVLDPVSAHGISNAFRDAELLAGAVSLGLAGGGPAARCPATALHVALDEDHRRPDRAALPLYYLTARVARLGPLRLGERLLYSSLRGRPGEISRFFGVLSGTGTPRRSFSPGSLLPIIGC